MDDSPAIGRLFLVGTPIGNLRDITLRALDCLREVDVIACEDTRHSKRLLDAYEISGKLLVSYHQHNEAKRSVELVARALSGESIAVISDAGMPSISDPGQRVAQEAIENGVAVEVIPGCSAVLTGLSGSGLDTSQFYFGGFLDNKSGRRERELLLALERPCTSIYYESPHRILKTLAALAVHAPERQVCVARELTKKFETYHRGTAPEILSEFAEKQGAVKGEITFLIAGKPPEKRRPKNKYPKGGNE